MTERFHLLANGQDITGWKTCSLGISMDALAREFSFDLAEKVGGQSINVVAGHSCEVYLMDEVLGLRVNMLKGYIDTADIGGSADENIFAVSGRDVCGDLVDSSVLHKTGTWRRVRLVDIVKDICKPFNIPVSVSPLFKEVQLIERFSLQQGETAYSAIARLCSSQGVLPQSTANGGLLLTYTAPTSARAIESLVVGENVLRWRRKEEQVNRHSEYHIKGQQGGNGASWTGDMLGQSASAVDGAVGRYRPLLFMAETRATPELLRRRVAWEAQVRAGRAVEYDVTLSSWFQRNPAGYSVKPWAVNELVRFSVPSRSINEELIVTGVKFNLSVNDGRKVDLSLRRAGTFAPNPLEKVELY